MGHGPGIVQLKSKVGAKSGQERSRHGLCPFTELPIVLHIDDVSLNFLLRCDYIKVHSWIKWTLQNLLP